MKKFLLIILSVALVICIAGCGSFSPPIILPEPPIEGDNPDKPSKPGDGTQTDDDYFTVTLVSNGAPFYPTETIFAQWTGEEGTHLAPFNEVGVAQITGLDGEYRVTLSNLPYNCTYDPNGYYVDNENMDCTIEILQIVMSTSSTTTSMYHCLSIARLGTYRTVLSSQSQKIFFEYAPTKEGRYSIESWVDVTANEVNPMVDIYTGNSAWKQFSKTQNDGGTKSTYTKNFRWEVSLYDYEIGNSWSFAVHADNIGNHYPVTVDFTIKLEGDLPKLENNYTSVTAKGPFYQKGETDVGKTFNYLYAVDISYTPEDDPITNIDGILDESKVKLNPEDGFYHVWYSGTETYGPLIYATLTKDSPVLPTDSGNGFLDPLVNLQFGHRDYYDFMDFYSFYCNSEGRHPVNEELKDYLFNYSLNQRFFNDGNGWAESLGMQSDEDSQWLFCCGYYEDRA